MILLHHACYSADNENQSIKLMRTTLSMKLVNTLQKGKERLGKEAIKRISCFVESQRTEEDSFMDNSGKGDLYYTLFGWMLSYILGIRLDQKKMAVYLANQDIESLDLIHYAAYIRCWMIKQLMGKGKVSLLLRSLFTTDIKDMNEYRGLPHNDPYSPYTQFIRLSLLEDIGRRIKDKNNMMDSLAKYHLPEGGFMNTIDGLMATTNATAAALAVIGQLFGYEENEDILYLRDQQKTLGGFAAAKTLPVPDLLSTATSLFMLECYNIKPKYSAYDFIEAHWLNTGGFAATLLEDNSDVEYTFYGMLALGTLTS